jgi:hypothetical protein
MNDNNTNQTSNRPNRQKQNNPMWSRHHSQASKDKMSASHKAYQERIRQQQAPQGMTMAQFLGMNDNLDIKGYIQSLMKKEGIQEIIREEIKKLL